MVAKNNFRTCTAFIMGKRFEWERFYQVGLCSSKKIFEAVISYIGGFPQSAEKILKKGEVSISFYCRLYWKQGSSEGI